MVRVARLAGWTEEEMRSQSLSYVYELAADAILENDTLRTGTEGGGAAAPPSGSRTRIIRYTLKPTEG